jgi:cytochrome P450
MTTSTGEPDVIDEQLMHDPYRGWGRLREQAALVHGTYMGQGPAWYATRFTEARAVLDDPRFVNNPASVPGASVPNAAERLMAGYGIGEREAHYLLDSLLNTDPPDHARLRKLVSRAFTVRRVGELRPRVEQITEGLLDELATAGPEPVDLVDRFCYPLPITVICELVGIPEAERASWRQWGRDLTSMDPARMPDAVRAMIDDVRALIESRRAEPAEDLISALVRVRDTDGDRLSDSELVTFVLTLVMAGHETTAHLLGNSVVALLTHPDQLRSLRERPGLWPDAVSELVRWCGIALIASPRYASTELELGGQRLARGEMVVPVLVGANFDPRRYDDPDRFDVTRTGTGHGEPHTGFGHGAHYCLGAALARQETEVALRALFERFPGIALAAPDAEPAWQPVPGARRLSELPVLLTG